MRGPPTFTNGFTASPGVAGDGKTCAAMSNFTGAALINALAAISTPICWIIPGYPHSPCSRGLGDHGRPAPPDECGLSFCARRISSEVEHGETKPHRLLGASPAGGDGKDAGTRAWYRPAVPSCSAGPQARAHAASPRPGRLWCPCAPDDWARCSSCRRTRARGGLRTAALPGRRTCASAKLASRLITPVQDTGFPGPSRGTGSTNGTGTLKVSQSPVSPEWSALVGSVSRNFPRSPSAAAPLADVANSLRLAENYAVLARSASEFVILPTADIIRRSPEWPRVVRAVVPGR